MVTDIQRPESPLLDDEEPDLSLGRLVAFLRRHLAILIAAPLVVAAIVVAATWLLVGDMYRASAMLIFNPIKISRLSPEALTAEDYQRLLQSDAVVSETARRLVAAEVFEPGERATEQMASQVFPLRSGERGQTVGYSPMLEVVGTASSGEAAATIANTWVEVMLAHRQRLLADSSLPVVEAVGGEYSRRREEVRALETSRIELANDYQARMGDLELDWIRKSRLTTERWDRRLIEVKKESEDQIARYQNETRAAFERLAKSSSPPDYADPTLFHELAALRTQLAQTPEVRVLEKAISDDALWDAMATSQQQPSDLVSLASATNLITQEVNTVYSELMLRTSRIETILAGTGVSGYSVQLETLQRERSAGLAKLFATRQLIYGEETGKRATALAELVRTRQQEITALERERNQRVEAIDTEIAQKRETLSQVSTDLEQAVLLAEMDKGLLEVQVASLAVAPDLPEPKSIVEALALGVVAGLLFGVIAAMLRESRV